jgi:CRP-like cAMP-binding protein
MPDVVSRASTSNRLLSRLSRSDFALLEPHLEHVDLPVRRQLERRDKRIDHVYFPESGFASVVANGDSERGIEVGIIGREGMTGLAIVFGKDRARHETYIQVAGGGQRISSAHLRKALEQSSALLRTLLLYAHNFLMQASDTALANGRSNIEQRLARWLPMADDRLDGELPLTQEFLSIMLGVRRAGVTAAVQELERQGLIASKRGGILIIDREALRECSGGTYSPLERD